MCYVAVSETEKLIWDSDSEEQCVSDDSDVEAANDLLENSDNSVLIDELWHQSKSENRAKIHHLPAQKPSVIVVFHKFLTFTLFLTDVCRWTTEHYFDRVKSLLKTTHSRTERQKYTTRYFC
jgi:hypothetical protein